MVLDPRIATVALLFSGTRASFFSQLAKLINY
jgi:hypothetical protein